MKSVMAMIALAYAGNFSTPSKPALKYWDQGVCEQTEGTACFDVDHCPLDQCSIQTVDDTSRPKYVKRQVTACGTQDECKAELAALTCTDDGAQALIDAGFTQVYCAVPNGFESKQVLVKDDAKAAAAAQAQTQADQRAKLIADGRKRQASGQNIIALITANNDAKGLTADQTVQLTQSLAPIIGLLQTGALQSAKGLISQLQPNGVITQADIDLALAQFTAEGY